MNINRTSFLIDGFNLYHSVRYASEHLGLGGAGTKWLNIHSLCNSYLSIVGKSAQTTEVFYFSALAKHIEAREPQVTERHQHYIECLESTGVHIELHRFKPKNIKCDHCGERFIRHEEKETDVALSVRLLELFMLDRCDTAVLVSGDTDVAPAVETALRLFPEKVICFAFPYARRNKDLANMVRTSFTISKESYRKHQFPDPVVLTGGKEIFKPPRW